MSRISLTEECAGALEEARWVTRSGCVGDLLADALDGRRGALDALRETWPADTSGPRARSTYVRDEVMEGLAELAHEAENKPAMGPRAPAMLGITELLRVTAAKKKKKSKK